VAHITEPATAFLVQGADLGRIARGFGTRSQENGLPAAFAARDFFGLTGWVIDVSACLDGRAARCYRRRV